jgi:hypothetical protein
MIPRLMKVEMVVEWETRPSANVWPYIELCLFYTQSVHERYRKKNSYAEEYLLYRKSYLVIQ